jgi:uncharacterized membrane protein
VSNVITFIATWCAAIIEAIGISLIALLAGYALFNAASRLLKNEEKDSIFQDLRQLVGRGILLGLEFLIAADIIYTVAVDLTFESVGVLAIVIIIRTFLSFTMEVELTGRWPWQHKS